MMKMKHENETCKTKVTSIYKFRIFYKTSVKKNTFVAN